MGLPEADKAFVAPDKMTDYLLSAQHEAGSSKSLFFRSLGFDETNIGLLAARLKLIAQRDEVASESVSAHGRKYVVDGGLEAIDGRVVIVRTVWIIRNDETNPRFVTAYPARRKPPTEVR